MTYATDQDLIQRFGQYEIEQLALTSDGTQDANRIQAALVDATAEINSYLGQRHQVPVAAPSPVLQAACCDMARYQLYAAQATEEVTQRYQQRIAWLRDVASGKASLGIAEREASSSALAVATQSGGRVFSRDTLRDF